MARIFFDTEFTGLHKDTSLISIGLISEDNKCFYAEFSDYDETQVNDWIQDNVINNLWIQSGRFSWDYPDFYYFAKKEEIALKLAEYFKQFDSVELVSDVCHYDMVLLIDLFGNAFNLPDNVSAVCHDINQDIADFHNISDAEAFHVSREEVLENNNLEIKGSKHNALYDAKVIKAIYEIVNKDKYRE